MKTVLELLIETFYVVSLNKRFHQLNAELHKDTLCNKTLPLKI